MSKDFSGQNLRGKSFANQDLTGANFSNADIRGANFKKAKLVGANFSHAVAGLQNSLFDVIMFILNDLFFAPLQWIVIYSTLYSSIIVDKFPDKIIRFGGRDGYLWLTLPLFLVYGWLYILFFGFRTMKDGTFGTLLFSLFIVLIWMSAQNNKIIMGEFYDIIEFTGIIVATIGLPIIMSFLASDLFVTPFLIRHTYCLNIIFKSRFLIYLFGSVTPTISRPLNSWFTPCYSLNLTLPTLYASMVFVFWACLIGYLVILRLNDSTVTLASVIITLLTFRATRDIFKEPKFVGEFESKVYYVAKKGTNFEEADLTEANFEEALLKNTIFKNATVTRTCWLQAKQLNLADVRGSILTNRVVRELLRTGNGKGQSFRGLNLKGAYLAGADLSHADLTEVDLSEATLQEANLTGTKLTKTQALHTDFRNAIFTGACLQAWNIDHTTQLKGVNCEYVYLLEQEGERRPNSGIFVEGEFTKLFQEVLNTVDFIFKNGIDWKVFLISFNNLKVTHENAEILVQGIENKGDGVFVVKVNVPPEMDRSRFHSELKLEYENQLRLKDAELQRQERTIAIYHERNTNLLEKNTDLLEIIHHLAQRPTFEIGELNMNDKYGGIHVEGNVQGGLLNAGVMKDVTNTIQQLPDSSSPGQQTSLKSLLMQLHTLIIQADDKEIPQSVKTLALEQIKILATVGNPPNEEEHKKTAQLVLPVLKGVVAHLPTAVVAHGLIAGISHFFE